MVFNFEERLRAPRAGSCYVGLHELYGLAVPDPEAGGGVRRIAVFKGDRKAAYRLEGGDPVIEEVAVAGRPPGPALSRGREGRGGA